ncbi:SPOR domain-containing protein [Photobacterium lipolyticum]|uniref:AAA family ATPase n=1 Tax=Photobacterium lipolyticum TaxID=266810 RepID=A0A2T3MYD4_9GAMM|nr:AAA family ATPase [Photobacterium lipolyticum]PSW04861.1 AAA family ATPase [Photobacterium lipolyticum]
MTSDSNARTLDLDSQIQLLSRIQFLTRFSSNLIQVTGGDGAGKTWLAQRYLEYCAADTNQALLTCYPTQTDSQHRSILLKQLVAKPLFNDQDPLVQSLERMLEGNRCNVLLVIDDAQLLSPTMIAELWALVLKAQNEPLWQINILLLSQPGRLNKYLDQVSHGQGQVPLELEISDLTEQEVQSFVEVMLSGDQLDANGRRALKEKAAATVARPGALMQLDHTESKDMTNSSSRILSPAALFVVLLAVIGAGLVFWLFPADDETTAYEGVRTAVNTDNVAAVEESSASLKTGRFDEPEQVEADKRDPATVKSVTPQDGINDDSHVLPPELSLEGLTVGRNDDSKRVVVPSQVVDAMISEQALGGSGEQAIAQQELPNEIAMTTLTESLVETAEPAAVLTPEPEPRSVSMLGSELKAIDSRHYTLQLAALKSLAAAKKFVAEHDISEIATLYETRRNGEPWFIVITGDYPDIVTARRAETQLPGGVQAVQPWVKSYAQIHREIDRVK